MAQAAYIHIIPIMSRRVTLTIVSIAGPQPTEWDARIPLRMTASISTVMEIRNASGAGLSFPMQDLDVRYPLMVDMNFNIKK